MGRFIVEGGRPLRGKLKVQGAKNAALPILAAAVMSRGEISLLNCPRIADVGNMLGILEELGAEYAWEGDVLRLCAERAGSAVMPPRLSRELRSSIFMLGPLLARFGWAVCSYPGGCEIGLRPVDLHLSGLAALGAEIREERGRLICDGGNMRGTDIHLDYPSVGATENIMMAAVAARGDTCITNAAREPEIEDLQRFLNSIGCAVYGAGTSSIYIKGGMQPTPCAVHSIMPDRIAAGTFLCAAAMTGGEIELVDVCPGHMGSMIAKLREAGCDIAAEGDRLRLSIAGRTREIKMIETLPR